MATRMSERQPFGRHIRAAIGACSLTSLAFPFDCPAVSAAREAPGKLAGRCWCSLSLLSDRKSHQRPSLSVSAGLSSGRPRAGAASTRDRATNICWRILVRTAPGAKLHRPEGAGRSSASSQGGDFEGSKNLDPEKIRCGVNFPGGGIARICVGRHSGIEADSDTWHQRAGGGRTSRVEHLPDDHLHGEDVDADQIGRHCAGVVARAKPGVVWRRLAGRIDLPATQRSEAHQNSLQPLARK